jgi:hypothetical protein
MDLSQFTPQQSASIILRKIYQFDSIQSFNFHFFNLLHKYFMSYNS